MRFPAAHCKRAVRAVTLAALLFYAGYAYPASPSFQCGDMKAAIRAQFDAGRGFLAVAAERSGFSIMLFLDQNTGSFAVLGIDENLNACEILKGDSWQWALTRTV